MLAAKPALFIRILGYTKNNKIKIPEVTITIFRLFVTGLSKLSVISSKYIIFIILK